MLFNSFEFLIFLPVVFILYWFVFNKSLKWQNFLVLIASYFFYGWWSWKFMILLALSTLLDFLYGFGVASINHKKSKFFLWLSVFNNLGILGLFKYYNFFAKEFQKTFDLFGLHASPILLNIALPIGISFYTFHGMSYVFDIYRGKQKPVTNFIEYAVFVSFFPLLVAGPIERAHHLLPQIQLKRNFNTEKAQAGLGLIIWGLVKKIVVADNLALAVNDIFSNAGELKSISLILGAIYFSFQIYCDFSGYTDIARGVANLLGFDLLINFNNPYLSKSIPEFWKRWHISLTSWFRDYLYIPLGGSKVNKVKRIRNVFIIFFVSGFWHGANWTFIIWGFIHALCFLSFLLSEKRKENIKIDSSLTESYILNSLKIIGTFVIITITWIFFRAENLNNALIYYKRLFFSQISINDFISWRSNSTEGSHFEFLFILFVFFISSYIYKIRFNVLRNSILIILLLIFGNFISPANFIYFQF